jgi:ABC-type multidrug transport system fused ATPase/permease subunit
MVVVAALLISLDPMLGLLAIVLVPAGVGVSMAVFHSTRKWWQKVWRADMRVRMEVGDYVEHSRLVQFYVGRAGVTDALRGRVENAREANWDAAARGPVYFAVIAAAIGTIVPVLLFVGVRQVMAGQVNLPTLVVFMTYAAQLYSPVTFLGRSLRELAQSWISGLDVFGLLDMMSPAAEPEQGPTLMPRPESASLMAVEMSRVSFVYTCSRNAHGSITKMPNSKNPGRPPVRQRRAEALRRRFHTNGTKTTVVKANRAKRNQKAGMTATTDLVTQ